MTVGRSRSDDPSAPGGATLDLEAFLDAAPDAILAVDRAGTIRAANRQAGVLFGFEQSTLVGRSIEELLPARLRGRHADHRDDYWANPRPRAMGAALDLVACHADGTEFPVDVSLSVISTDHEPLVWAFARDATARKSAEQHGARLRRAEAHRAQALEINDNVVQGLAGALMRLEAGNVDLTARYLTRMLASMRAWIDELLHESGDDRVTAGDLVRRAPAEVLHPSDVVPTPPAEVGDAGDDRIRVLIADDAPDIRLVLRLQLESAPDIAVVGEAANGEEAIDRAERLRPDVILLDLAMPVLDGLQALPILRTRVPDAAVVVVSGFGSGTMRPQVLKLGAGAYLEKGAGRDEVLAAIRRVADGDPVPV